MALGRVASILLGSKLRIALVVVAALATVVAAGAAMGVLGAPSVVGVDNRFGDVNGTTTAIESDLHVHNPNPVGVRLGGTTVDYGIAMNDVAMANGTREGVGVERGNSTLAFTSFLRNERIPAWWVSHLRNGEHTTLTVDADVRSSLVRASAGAPTVERSVDTDVSSAFNSTETRPIDADQPVVSDPVLYLNETGGRWGDVTESETPIEMSFTVYNPRPYPITASSIGYDVTMNDVAVGNGSSERELVIPPGETRTIEATTVIRNDALDEWWVSHLERNQVTDLSIQFYARFDLSEFGGGTVRVPLDDVSHAFETDVFGTKNGTASDGDGSSSGDEPNDETATLADETASPTDEATDTATDAPTDAETTSDDGLLPGDETDATATTTTEDDGGLL